MTRRRPLPMRLKDEEGVAMITAILVSVIVISLSAVAIQLAVHNVGTSAYDRKRVQAVAAAEAGIDATMEELQTAQAQTNGTVNLPCSYVPGSALAFQSTPVSMQLGPGAQYQVAGRCWVRRSARSCGTSTRITA